MDLFNICIQLHFITQWISFACLQLTFSASMTLALPVKGLEKSDVSVGVGLDSASRCGSQTASPELSLQNLPD